MDFAALTAKGVSPRESRKARLDGWRLRFNVEHFFRHEGGVANIEQTGRPQDAVCGVLHVCDAPALAALDKLEGYGVGYDRIEVPVETARGVETAQAYIGLPAYVNDACLPTQRYLNILLRGARAAALDPDYVAMLGTQALLPPVKHPEFQRTHTGQRLNHTQLEAHHTVLAGHVFCMKDVRFAHELARSWFGGKEVTQFHLRRMDNSTGTEQLDRFLDNDLRPDQRDFLNTYLHAFDDEYRHIGVFDYSDLPQSKIMV